MTAPLPIDAERVARELALTPQQVSEVVALLDEGNTVPFVVRYRKERTGNLDEEQVRAVQERVGALRQLAERAGTILRLIEAQGKLTPDLRRAIEQAETLKRLDDLYLPFRPKRTSRAQQARVRGLGPLAEAVRRGEFGDVELEARCAAHVDAERGLADAAAVRQGVASILAEELAEDAENREIARKVAWETGSLKVSEGKSAAESGAPYRGYFDYAEAVSGIPAHRVLAVNRGETAGALRVRFAWDEERVRDRLVRRLGLERHPQARFLEECLREALDRHLEPSLEREVRRELTERAESHAIGVFARNLRNLLLQPPLPACRVAAVDPGFRTGCKLAALDECGALVETDVVFLGGSEEKRAAARDRLADFLLRTDCRLVAVGNGTACREAEELVAEAIAARVPDARYVVANEAGASIYSTGDVARAEFPGLDATVRGTVSIGRRVQDPLSELVKIEPQHIGVGMYQHDVPPKRLEESLDRVVESCVNFVGVDLNTASASLLRRVSGFGPLLARRIVEHREKHGRFASRRQLLDVAGIGPATFTQAAGFLKVLDGDEPLDRTWIHPESYDAARKVLEKAGLAVADLGSGREGAAAVRERVRQLDPAATAAELGVGLPTLTDILEALARPGRDPRSDLPGPIFKKHVLSFDDLAPGLELAGTVLNVVDFGAFVDVGLKDSGLVHVSQLARHFVRSPHDVVAVGDRVTVWVLGIDAERRRVSLTMIPPGESRRPPDAVAEPGARPALQTAAPPPARAEQGRGPKPAEQGERPAVRTDAPHDDASPREGPGTFRGFGELKQHWDQQRRGR